MFLERKLKILTNNKIKNNNLKKNFLILYEPNLNVPLYFGGEIKINLIPINNYLTEIDVEFCQSANKTDPISQIVPFFISATYTL